MINIILCGGNGTRLWPLSRKYYPKQFYILIDKESLFQKTIRRNFDFCQKSIIVTNNDQYFLALDHLEEMKEIDKKNYEFILEPIARNTAPAISLACHRLKSEDIVLVTPSDHLIGDLKEYEKVIKKAEELAQKGYIVTFGIKPDYPETGFGYIEAKGYDVISFKEKPDMETAKVYLEKRNYFWNSGMFVFKVEVYLGELKKYAPDIFITSQKTYCKAIKDSPMRIKLEDMMTIPENSIDYAVIEKSSKVKVIPSDIQWCDLGSFESLYKNLAKSKDGNITSQKNINIDSKNNMILSSNRIIATIDIEDLIVVDTLDAILISKSGSSYKIKDVIKEVEKIQPNICNNHLTVYRPWGTYTVLEKGYKYKVKKIVVKPGKKLSLQKHYHRNEHWIIAEGTAKIVLGDNEFILRENGSAYIPMGEIHRLENPGIIDLVIIETQIGDYLEEEDIVRIRDDYGREHKDKS